MTGTIDLTGEDPAWPGVFRPSKTLLKAAHRMQDLAEGIGYGADAEGIMRGAMFIGTRAMWERIMARMVSPKAAKGRAAGRPVITEPDLPSLSELSNTLTDLGRNTTFTVEFARGAFAELEAKGNEVHDLAQAMHGWGRRSNWWRDEDGDVDLDATTLHLLRRLDRHLRRAIVDGWMIWTKVSWVYDHITKEERAEFRDRWGFLGNRKVGWLAMGKKMLLHSPYLAATQPFRRRIQKRNWYDD